MEIGSVSLRFERRIGQTDVPTAHSLLLSEGE
jgi:hypothetical protein